MFGCVHRPNSWLTFPPSPSSKYGTLKEATVGCSSNCHSAASLEKQIKNQLPPRLAPTEGGPTVLPTDSEDETLSSPSARLQAGVKAASLLLLL